MGENNIETNKYFEIISAINIELETIKNKTEFLATYDAVEKGTADSPRPVVSELEGALINTLNKVIELNKSLKIKN